MELMAWFVLGAFVLGILFYLFVYKYKTKDILRGSFIDEDYKFWVFMGGAIFLVIVTLILGATVK